MSNLFNNIKNVILKNELQGSEKRSSSSIPHSDRGVLMQPPISKRELDYLIRERNLKLSKNTGNYPPATNSLKSLMLNTGSSVYYLTPDEYSKIIDELHLRGVEPFSKDMYSYGSSLRSLDPKNYAAVDEIIRKLRDKDSTFAGPGVVLTDVETGNVLSVPLHDFTNSSLNNKATLPTTRPATVAAGSAGAADAAGAAGAADAAGAAGSAGSAGAADAAGAAGSADAAGTAGAAGSAGSAGAGDNKNTEDLQQTNTEPGRFAQFLNSIYPGINDRLGELKLNDPRVLAAALGLMTALGGGAYLLGRRGSKKKSRRSEDDE